jgi:hypothetical protein
VIYFLSVLDVPASGGVYLTRIRKKMSENCSRLLVRRPVLLGKGKLIYLGALLFLREIG